jgi:BlaI family transcriptional regulator, penicillinase repressor
VPPKQSETLTEAELRVMNVLWERGSGTVQQVLDSITSKPALAYNSVLTTIRILERKGYLKHIKDGRAHIFAPVVQQEEATRSEIRHLVSRFFKNSHEDLVLNILEDQGIEPEELARLRKMLVRDDVPTSNQANHQNEVRSNVRNDVRNGNDVQNNARSEAK